MKFIMTTTLFATMFLATSAMAGPQSGAGTEEHERGKPAAACEKQHQQCMKQCDKEKRMWFFKGEAYETCAETCEARQESCMAAGREKTSSGRDMRGRDDAAERSEEMREDAAERREDADDRSEEMREGTTERRDEARAAVEERRNAAEQRRGRVDDEDNGAAEAEETEAEEDDGKDGGKARGKDRGNGR